MSAEHQDWIERAMAQSAWEPPDGFTDRVVLHAMTARPRRVSLRKRLPVVVTGLFESARARLEGSVWVVRQYRDLMLHS